ncbi:LysR family transcriptional regulator [Roseivivax isoporae]|uniref:HTH lysR-type domain-containing protein n=1 Tax=Roseivivax isoporae LMG 25204 TaxID=1449351 RepID=X7F609_9RHOB|nr:LysR family transcriptional regulator [Roseivivax isoporae]ETX27489.1 hypothetical protein RISW2_13760 [Roseivivax isoporae LMG 25204]
MSDALASLTLRQFRLILAIAEDAQLSVAAERLALTQPGASRMLAEIERLVGQPLFDRHAKGMRPTPVGEVLARHAATLLGGLDQAASEMAAFRAGRTGTVRVGAVTGAAVAYVVPAIQTLRRDAAGVDIRVDVAPSVDLMGGLLAGEYDFVLARVPSETDTTAIEVLRGRTEDLALLGRAGHPMAGDGPLGLAGLSSLTWVMQAPGMPIRAAVDAAYLAEGLAPPSEVVDTASLLVTLAYLRDTNAVAPAAREVADLLIGAGAAGIVRLPLARPITLSPYNLIRRRQRPASPVAERLMTMVLDRLGQ